MKFVLELQTDHEAFDGDEGDLEVARILRITSDMVTRGGVIGGGIADPDGKTIGHWRFRRGVATRPAPE